MLAVRPRLAVGGPRCGMVTRRYRSQRVRRAASQGQPTGSSPSTFAAKVRPLSAWAGVEPVPADPILGLVAQFKVDERQQKVNLAQGAYRADDGNPYLLRAVAAAEATVAADVANGKLDHEYAGIEGLPDFIDAAQKFVFGGDCSALAAGRIAGVQTLSGTGSLRVCAETLYKVSPHKDKTIWLSAPSWGNHANIFRSAGHAVQSYRYIDEAGTGLDATGLLHDLKELLPKGSVVLLHASAHNPTGVDPSPALWDEIMDVCASRDLLPIMDTAYQGFASGCPVTDGYAVRAAVAAGCNPMVCQSFAKNMGLYGERVGCLNVVCGTANEAEAVISRIKQEVIRPNYSSPPLHGARIAARVMTKPELRDLWAQDLQLMSQRILRLRGELRSALVQAGAACPAGSSEPWAHITDQIGMFAYTGLSAAAVDVLRIEHGVYLTRDGRLSLAGLQTVDVEYTAMSISSAIKAVA